MNHTSPLSARHLTWPMLAAYWGFTIEATKREAALLARDECGQPDTYGDELLPLMASLMVRWEEHQIRWSSVK